ncbi:Transcription factor UPBEAT1 [Rhynchospora pubera]|uniref:Transcription factor UPBEAT1 n=1 Tax=Rhynchospora pubera TaxID=906938 RepID=A0AAV8DNY3_9POAL|nr:Transcription factor UPBEAT1 [Rhynchospora pubera]KAJ4797009.1 Transcription factor UPBEAT1 [Rhynchospora pubera]
MVSTTHSVCHSSRCKQTRSSSLLIRAVQQSTSSSSLRRNKQIMARGNIGVISRRRAMQKNNRRKVEGSRKPVGPIVRKIQTLRQLVPGGDMTEIDDLFCAAADYILTLQMKVRVMEFMVNMFTPQDPDN